MAVSDEAPLVRERKEHGLSRRDIDSAALRVLYRLHEAGYTAYLVGGGVRDLLLGRRPKDFDVATDAHPNQIRKLFRNCMLIGRRFRLAHIRFGETIIETSTFRRQPETPDEEAGGGGLLVRRDNTFGTPEEDARRRDFTVNGLFYDIATFDVIDHVGGLEDLERRVIRCIGDPDVRFREDPVRMIRAVRFASRLGFSLEEATLRGIQRHREEIRKASANRLFEEVCRLFPFRSGEAAVRLLRQTGLLAVMLPEVDGFMDHVPEGSEKLYAYLRALDARPGEESPSNPGPVTALASLFYEPLRWWMRDGGRDGRKMMDEVGVRYRIPKRLFFSLLHVMAAQPKLDQGDKRRGWRRALSHESFPGMLEFLEVRVGAGLADAETLAWWRTQQPSVPPRQTTSKAGRTSPRKSRRRRPGTGRRGASRPRADA